MLGLKRRTVLLVKHQRTWRTLFAKERSRLLKNIPVTVEIEHIGSTAIHGIPAKPIIDIALGLQRMSATRKIRRHLLSLGYQFRPSASRKNHLLFVKGPEAKRTHYLHVMRLGGATWKRDLFFRDYLRTNRQRAELYERLKTRLAKKYSKNRSLYTKHKKQFIHETLRRRRAHRNRV